MANGGTAPASVGGPDGRGQQAHQAECQAAKALNIAVNPQFGQLDYSQYQVVTAPRTVTRPRDR